MYVKASGRNMHTPKYIFTKIYSSAAAVRHTEYFTTRDAGEQIAGKNKEAERNARVFKVYGVE